MQAERTLVTTLVTTRPREDRVMQLYYDVYCGIMFSVDRTTEESVFVSRNAW